MFVPLWFIHKRNSSILSSELLLFYKAFYLSKKLSGPPDLKARSWWTKVSNYNTVLDNYVLNERLYPTIVIQLNHFKRNLLI